MKNKKKRKVMTGILGIVVFLIGITIYDKFTNFASFAYIEDVYLKNNSIIICIYGANGDSKYHHYELNEIGDGIYELQLYASVVSGKHFPVEIVLDNELNRIKEIRQKPNIADEEKEYEIIYPKTYNK